MSVEIIHKTFPNLAQLGYAVTSEETIEYNCLAWAAGDITRCWWPAKEYYWPAGVPLDETVDAFVAAYGTIGYVVCDDGALEVGFEKLAFYVDANGIPTHAAKQVVDGNWSSKLGELEDVRHSLDGLVGVAYGSVFRFMKRVRS